MNYLPQIWHEEEKRIAINFEMAYDNWLQRQKSPELEFNYQIKEISGQRYLYSKNRKTRIEKSMGPFDTALQEKYHTLIQDQELAKQYETEALEQLEQLCNQFKTIKLPKLHKTIGKILRQLDKEELLGEYFLVAGSIAFYSYGVAAGVKDNNFYRPTNDLDFTWYHSAYLKRKMAEIDLYSDNSSSSSLQNSNDISKYKSFLYSLRQIDKSFNMDHKRSFQAKNSEAFEVELLCSPTSLPSLHSVERQFKPLNNIVEQEWLLKGRPVRQILLDENNLPVPIVSPDPRWMALHKLWLSKKPERDPRKKTKDLEQGKYLMYIVSTKMEHDYPLDPAFAEELPAELVPVFEAWCTENNFIVEKKKSKFVL